MARHKDLQLHGSKGFSVDTIKYNCCEVQPIGLVLPRVMFTLVSCSLVLNKNLLLGLQAGNGSLRSYGGNYERAQTCNQSCLDIMGM